MAISQEKSRSSSPYKVQVIEFARWAIIDAFLQMLPENCQPLLAELCRESEAATRVRRIDIGVDSGTSPAHRLVEREAAEWTPTGWACDCFELGQASQWSGSA